MRTGTNHQELAADRVWLARLAYRLVRDRDEADDVAQEACLAALESPPPLDWPRRGWLGRVAVNRVRARYRSDTRRGRREELADPPAPPRDGHAALHAAEAASLLSAAVAELAEPFQSAVLLRFVEELSVAEVAARQGI